MKENQVELKVQLNGIIVENLKLNKNLKNEIEIKENEKHDFIKDLAINIIDIIDSIENIDEWIIENEFHMIDEAKKISNRYKTIHKKLIGLLQKQGITKIEFPENRLIVGFCEVLETENDSRKRNDEIVSIIRNGYIRGKELIRAAQLIVVKN
jgi:molecular chaperone GrpE (heat shock protein)